MNEETTTECLYYRAYRSFLLQEPDFKLNYEILADQYKRFPDTFKQFSKNDVIRLIRMQEAYKTGTFNLFKGVSINFQDITLPKTKTINQSHYNLVKSVYKSGALEKYTGSVKSFSIEYPVIYGSIDLMIIAGDCAYAVEFKTDTAKHDIIGQVIKYYIGLCLQLNLKFYNDVKIITVCPGYDDIVLKSLKQIGAIVLLIDHKNLKISEVF